MYEQVETKRSDKKGWLLRVLLPIAVAVLLIGSIVLIWAVQYHVQYRDFVSRLSDSVTYAYSHHTLHGDAGEAQPVWVKGETVYHLYNYIVVSGEGKVIRKLPETEPGIDLDFGDGSNLKAWDSESGGAILCYTDDAGQYAFVAKSVSVETMQVNFLSLSDNIAWKEK